MIEPGQILSNPVTKERMTFLRTSAQTGGDHVLVELRSAPGGFVAAAHTHPAQIETFEIVSGTLGAKVGRRQVEARAGETLVVDQGTPHKWWNAGDDELVFRCEIRPAGQFEQLIETMFSLAADGKTNRKGMPNPLRLAVIAEHHFADVQLPFPPPALQRLGLALGAPLGRLLGYRPVYVPAAGVPAVESA
jgi:mannose-6-phosphate isomerase-like protein (cupin superfamily)